MKILNLTRNTVLAQEALVADTPWKRMKGLLGKRNFEKGQALILQPCNSIHAFFMRFPIDVLFVDKENKVIKAIPCLNPFRLTSIYWSSRFAIELPAGTIQATDTRESDTLLIRDTC